MIEFINFKYNLNIVKRGASELDTFPIFNNSWFSGMGEDDCHFGVKYRIAKSKSESRKRAFSKSVHILFILVQRSYDFPTNFSLSPIMNFISSNLNCKLSTYKYKPTQPNETR